MKREVKNCYEGSLVCIEEEDALKGGEAGLYFAAYQAAEKALKVS